MEIKQENVLQAVFFTYQPTGKKKGSGGVSMGESIQK